jgi:DNA polymerase-3 subunit gamma/tau
LLPIGDTSESGLLARIERLERVENIAQGSGTSSNSLRSHTLLSQPSSQSDSKPSKPVDPADYVSPATAEAKRVPSNSKPKEADGTKAVSEASAFVSQTSEAPQASERRIDSIDVAGLRRLWPDVIENVKKRRRLTWSLLSASAQILGVDEKIITIGIVNAGARDSFIRSESEEILRQAFIEVVGLDRKIECTVDPSIDTTSTPEARAVRTSEAPSDPTQLSGAALLAAELGATVISETSHD